MNIETTNENLTVDNTQTVFVVEYSANEQTVVDSIYRFVTHADERRKVLDTLDSSREVNIRPYILM